MSQPINNTPAQNAADELLDTYMEQADCGNFLEAARQLIESRGDLTNAEIDSFIANHPIRFKQDMDRIDAAQMLKRVVQAEKVFKNFRKFLISSKDFNNDDLRLTAGLSRKAVNTVYENELVDAVEEITKVLPSPQKSLLKARALMKALQEKTSYCPSLSYKLIGVATALIGAASIAASLYFRTR